MKREPQTYKKIETIRQAYISEGLSLVDSTDLSMHLLIVMKALNDGDGYAKISEQGIKPWYLWFVLNEYGIFSKITRKPPCKSHHSAVRVCFKSKERAEYAAIKFREFYIAFVFGTY